LPAKPLIKNASQETALAASETLDTSAAMAMKWRKRRLKESLQGFDRLAWSQARWSGWDA
jgi:hypothetical protein